MPCHYCMMKNEDVIDVPFVNITEVARRRRAIRNAINGTLVTLMAIVGFLFFPVLIYLVSGEDVAANAAESLGEGHFLFTLFHLTLDSLMALVAGFVGIALFPREE